MGKKTKKVDTVIVDLLQYLDRVENRGITTLSIEKIRERIKERIPFEKERMIRFANKAVKTDVLIWDELYEETFNTDSTNLKE